MWRLTPYQFSLLQKRQEEREQRLDFRAGQVCATLANVYRPKNRKPFKPADFFSSLSENQGKKKVMTPDEQLKVVKMLHGLFGGITAKKDK